MAAEPVLSQNLDTRNKTAEPKKKFLKKKRSIRFSRVPSLKASSRRLIMSSIDLGSDDSSQKQSISVGSSDSLPIHIKSSRSFIANKGESEFDDAKSIVSSSSGSTDSIVKPSAAISSDDGSDILNSNSYEFIDASLNLSKAEEVSQGKKKTNLRNAKVLIKNVSFKPKKALNEMDSYVNRATCSSIIKDSRFPEHVEIQQDEKGSDRISDTKVCRYRRCSLNGHCHESHPLVKKFSFRRRQQVKPLMNTKKSNPGSKPGSKPRTGFSADKKELKKLEITESVGRLMKNTKSKAFKDGQESLDLDSKMKTKSSENIPSDIALIVSSGDTDESSLNKNNDESMNNQASTESTQVPKFNRGKQISMWHLIHKQMISSLEEEEGDEANPRKQVIIDEEKQVVEEEAKEDTINGSYQGSINNVEERNQEFEIRKLFAIKLVREAIENILLPEIQDQSSETQSITSDIIEEDPQLPKDKYQEDNTENTANFSTNKDGNSAKESINEPSDNKLERKGVKSDKKSPSNWSSLKKWIVLQRFVKALEKVKQYKPRSQSNFPLESDPEGEKKVYLKRQSVDSRKRSEEWMLDYAIRKVVSELAPTQKKKVTLLVQAFETIVPPQDDHSTHVSWPRIKQERQISARKVEDSEESQYEINGQKVFTSSSECLVDGSEPYLNLENKDDSSSTIRATADDIDVKSTVTENTELDKPKTINEQLEINNVIEGSTQLQEPVAQNEMYAESKPEKIPTLSRESSLDSRLDKENYLRMWHMIYQHVASNIASKVDLLGGGGEEDKQVKDFDTTPRVISMGEKKFSKSDAVKLIQEAVNEILLHDEDVSDTQSVTSETTPDMFLYETNRNEVLNKTVSNTSVLNEEYVKEFHRSDSGVSVQETKPIIPKPKNWRKLKRLILLKRSIKAMEKSRKLKSLVPRKIVPSISDAEPEKVDLKHQMVNERKKAEQWMLDYAVQNIVSELTPARKKRVAMLVEAFEAVVPLPEV